MSRPVTRSSTIILPINGLEDHGAIIEIEEVDNDAKVEHPAHYQHHPEGIECIDVAEIFNFNLGNVIKYIWRADHAGDALQDLRKAKEYLSREIQRRERQEEQNA